MGALSSIWYHMAFASNRTRTHLHPLPVLHPQSAPNITTPNKNDVTFPIPKTISQNRKRRLRAALKNCGTCSSKPILTVPDSVVDRLLFFHSQAHVDTFTAHMTSTYGGAVPVSDRCKPDFQNLTFLIWPFNSDRCKPWQQIHGKTENADSWSLIP